MPVGATGPSVAAVDAQQAPATQRSDSRAKCDSVKPGVCGPSAPPTPHPANTHKSRDRDFVALTIINKATNSEDRMHSYATLDELYGEQDPEVRQAMLANPKFAKIVDGAAQALIEQTGAGDQALHYLHGLAAGSHPDLAAALLVSATRIFVEKGAVFSRNDKTLEFPTRTYVEDLSDLIRGSSAQPNRQARQAVKQLKTLVTKDPGQ